MATSESKTAPGVASTNDNAKLKHSVDGVTTRDDATDLGVPMLAGSPDEPQGPEDALGPGPKRGDYRNRLGGTEYQPHTTERIADAKPGEATATTVAQRPLADEIGDEKGRKGGVTTV